MYTLKCDIIKHKKGVTLLQCRLLQFEWNCHKKNSGSCIRLLTRAWQRLVLSQSIINSLKTGINVRWRQECVSSTNCTQLKEHYSTEMHSTSSKARFVYQADYLRLMNHQQERLVYSFMQRLYYPPHIVNEVYIKIWRTVANAPKTDPLVHEVDPATITRNDWLEFLAVDIPGPQLNTSNWKTFCFSIDISLFEIKEDGMNI